MNPVSRLLLALITLILLVPTMEAAAKTDGTGRYSIVSEFKEAYARPHRSLFGKRKMAKEKYARQYRPHHWKKMGR